VGRRRGLPGNLAVAGEKGIYSLIDVRGQRIDPIVKDDAHPSCAGLASTCGPRGDGDCCASPVVTGVSSASFYRSYDGVTPDYRSKAYPAQVSDFRLDTYEITVGRFRIFVAEYSQGIIAEGAG